MNIENMRVVSVDDNENNLLLIELFCKDLGLQVESFTNSIEALVYIIKNPIDLVIVDYMMPKLDGLELIGEFRKTNQHTPVVMITASEEEELHANAFLIGANDFLKKPVKSTLFKVRVTNLLSLYKKSILLQDKAKLLAQEVKMATRELKSAELETLEVLGRTAEYKDTDTGNHILRVARYAKIIAREYGLSEEEQDILFYSAPFHDIGKVGIEDKILLKPGKLTFDEFEIMKTHVDIGYKILKNSKNKYLKAGSTICLTHHEKYDGTGYPNNLKGEDIHIFGRIVAIADVFDALTSKRPYKEAWDIEKALKLFESEKGKHFEPALIDIFIENIEEVKKVYEELN